METLRIALVGAGRIGQVHASTVAANKRAKLVGVFDPDLNLTNHILTTYGGSAYEFGELLRADDVDALMICSPTNLHATQIEQAVAHNKAVFCEKPIDLEIARVRACLDVVAEHNGRLMLGFNRRFDPNFVALKQATKKCGTIELVEIVSRDPAPAPAEHSKWSGGIFKDMMIHDIDMARFLLDEPIVEVSAKGSLLFNKAAAAHGDYDTAAVTLVAQSGALAVITNSRRTTYGYDQRIEVHGADGTVAAQNPRTTTLISHGANGSEVAPLYDFFTDRYDMAYRHELDYFIDAVRAGTPITPNGEDGLIALEIAQACKESAASGQTVRLGSTQ